MIREANSPLKKSFKLRHQPTAKRTRTLKALVLTMSVF